MFLWTTLDQPSLTKVASGLPLFAKLDYLYLTLPSPSIM